MDVVDEELEDRDRVGDVGEVGADAELGGELGPLVPGCCVGLDAGGRHPVFHVCACSIIDMCHIVAGDGWNICQYLS